LEILQTTHVRAGYGSGKGIDRRCVAPPSIPALSRVDRGGCGAFWVIVDCAGLCRSRRKEDPVLHVCRRAGVVRFDTGV